MEMSVREAGARLGLCDEQIRRMMRSGELASEKKDHRWITWESSIEKLIRDRTSPGKQAHRLVQWLALIPDADPTRLRALAAETFALPDADLDAALGAWAKNRPGARHNADVR